MEKTLEDDSLELGVGLDPSEDVKFGFHLACWLFALSLRSLWVVVS
jgi:hypothetical protein